MTIFYYLKGSPSSRKHISEVVCWKYLLGNNCYQPFVVFQPLTDCCSSAAHYILHELLLTWPNPTQIFAHAPYSHSDCYHYVLKFWP